jgi:hypothetical protein
MVDTGIFATTAQVQDKVGANASTVANTEEFINRFMAQAESVINGTVTFDFSGQYTSLDVKIQGLLTSAASAWAAIRVINYDPDSIGRSTANFKANVLIDEYNKAMAELKNKNTQEFIKKVA